MDSVLSEPALQGLPPPETPASPLPITSRNIEPSEGNQTPQPMSDMPSSTTSRRFKSVTEEEIRLLEDQTQSKSTKKNTKLGVNIFQG